MYYKMANLKYKDNIEYKTSVHESLKDSESNYSDPVSHFLALRLLKKKIKELRLHINNIKTQIKKEEMILLLYYKENPSIISQITNSTSHKISETINFVKVEKRLLKADKKKSILPQKS